jgi:hypothetical protein
MQELKFNVKKLDGEQESCGAAQNSWRRPTKNIEEG